MAGLIVTVALAAAAFSGSYDCTMARQVTITEDGAQSGEVNFPEADRDNWRFSLRVSEGREPSVTIDWPANPIQIAGRHDALRLAPGQLAFMAMSNGPCMFTEGACMTMVELSARADGSAAFSILPAGSLHDSANDTRSLFHVVFLGSCRPRGGAARP